ncbi:MAG: hypothetical protein AB9842_14665 [Bacteroidales bacterium]
MKMSFCVVFILLVSMEFGFGQLQPYSENMKDFYFPYKQMFNLKTRTYVNISDTTEFFNWELKTNAMGRDTFLSIRVYGPDQIIVEESHYKIRKSDVLLNSYVLYQTINDTLHSQETHILDSMVFDYNQRSEDHIQWMVQYQEPVFDLFIKLLKIRTFEGYEPNSGTIKFKDKYFIRVNEDDILSHINNTYYARNLGIVKYSVVDSKGISKLFVLKE